MHVAFRSEEIRSIVFEELPRASLASLAATCQDFHESALRILWRECGSLQLDHFAKYLPKTTCIYIVDKYVGESRPINRPVLIVEYTARSSATKSPGSDKDTTLRAICSLPDYHLTRIPADDSA